MANEKKERFDVISRKILTLEWDKQRNQLNQNKESYLKSLISERDTLRSELEHETN